MKSSLKKLRGFAVHKHEHKDKRGLNSAHLDELTQASEDMQDMRNCYDSLLSAAAATLNSAYEFSESLREMGACLLQRIASSDDEESGRVLIMLGKVQFELQKLVDIYRSHVVQTISTPSESLLNELRTVEEMKRQCDEKRTMYEHMETTLKSKGRLRNAKGESISAQQLQAAKEDYEDEATLFVFRLKSLKQGQSRSLLTQAARHHAAQLSFFKKGLRSLEEVEPHVKLVTEQHHIDYQFSGLEDDDADEGDDDDPFDGNDDGELSFDYGRNDHGQDLTTSRNSMELDQAELAFSPPFIMDTAKENLHKLQEGLPSFSVMPKVGSQSAPIYPNPVRKFDPAEKIKDMQPSSTRKFHTYVLPTPIDAKNTVLAGSSNPIPGAKHLNSHAHNLWHSSPLEPKKHVKDSIDIQSPEQIHTLKEQSVLKESNSSSIRVPLPLAQGLSQQLDTASDTKKIKRQAFSGPLTSKASNKSYTGPISSVEHPQLVSARLSRIPLSHSYVSPKVAPSNSPPSVSFPKISELHELPRPPFALTNVARSSLVGHSAPLVSRNQESSALSKTRLMTSHAASPLPIPPGTTVPRSFSIPSRSQRAMAFGMSRLMEVQNQETSEEVASPPLTPISLTNIRPVSSVPGSVTEPRDIRDN